MNRRKAKKIQEELAEKQAQEVALLEGSKMRDTAARVLETYGALVPMTETVQNALKIAIACTRSIDQHLGINK